MYHVMLDLETFGKNPGCIIRSVGAVLFNPRSVGFLEPFYATIDHQSCVDAGLVVEQETAQWWDRQSQEARDALLVDCRPLNVVAEIFSAWFRRNRCIQLWAQGASFDPPLWEHAMKSVGVKAPWEYYNVRDTRTLYEVAGVNTKHIPKIGVSHNALDDCKFQVACVQQAYSKLEPR